ncbi:MAG: FAD-dependent oxidoreductase [Rhodothermales bacterium]|nr:FAD-dependent oxidoreductase [Rhodothermales bacterium]
MRQQDMERNIVIIGNGVAGITAARFIRKNSYDRITVISSESDHFFSRTALMYIYMGHMTYQDTKPYEDWFWTKNRIDLIRDRVVAVDTDARRLEMGSGKPVSYDVLIIASGSQSNKFGWPGQDLRGVQGLYSLEDLEEMERQTVDISRAVVVGGGLIGIEMAEMLHSRHIPVTFLVRERSYMDYLLPAEESAIVDAEIRAHQIDLRLSTELAEITGNDAGHVNGVMTNHGERIECGFVGLTSGVRPNVGFLKGSAIELDRGVLVNDRFQTSADDVYAIGDCAQFIDPTVAHRPIEQLWYTARKHGKTVARTICGSPTRYERGAFFNSAKFFTLEYQTYGDIRSDLPDTQETLLWHNRSGRRLVRINFDSESRRVVGFNAFGVRLRHEVCEKWLLEGAVVDRVLPQLSLADFDPECAEWRLASAAAAINYSG